jgi:MraZ protein
VKRVFIGEYTYQIDDKGRMTIPVKYRPELGSSFIVTKGLDQCLQIFTVHEWERFQEKLTTLPMSSKDARAFNRFFFAGASEAALDKQGRVSITPNLRTYADIDKKVQIIGVSSRIEIWDYDKWNRYMDSDELSHDLIEEKMAMLGI